MLKIGIVGDRDSVLGFMALGFSVHEADDVEEATDVLRALVRSEEYAVIFLVENYAKHMADELARYKNMPLPAITVVPGSRGSEGYGMASIKSAVERAVGADILFKDND